MENKVQSKYDASSIQVLEGLEAVRKRPGMYIGTTGPRGLHHLVWEIVDNSIDEALAGYCDHIQIYINDDESVTVEDNGRGIPVSIHKQTGKSTLETIYTVLHAGGKFGGGGYKVSGGLHGVGASVVNALSTYLEVTVERDGGKFFERFENGGKPVGGLQKLEDIAEDIHGTTVRFKPDPEIFKESTTFDYETLRVRVQELAFLNKGLKISLTDKRPGKEQSVSYEYEGGISEYIKLLNKDKELVHEDIIDMEGEMDDISVEIALQYNKGYNELIYSFVNNIVTPEGGTHEDGVKRALTRVLNKYAINNNLLKEKDLSFSGEDVREGITLIVSVKHPDPQFEGQTKTKLGNMEVRSIVDRIFSESFEKYLLENPDVAQLIVQKAKTATNARMAAKKARELTRVGPLVVSNLPGKLADCSSKNAEECEIFIVEGDSAGGSAKSGRDSKTQAILPLRGKILNVKKSRRDRILSNKEIRSMITAFGTGIDEHFDIEKLRYHKIIIMTDADVDGAHIRILLLTFFYRFFRPLIEGGYIYAAQPPLYQLSSGKTVKYAYSDEERDELLKEFPENVKVGIQRYKGLGEMDAEQLWETTMNIEHRILLKITLDDAKEAERVLKDLMGEDVEPRRKFLDENAKYVENLDI